MTRDEEDQKLKELNETLAAFAKAIKGFKSPTFEIQTNLDEFTKNLEEFERKRGKD